MTNNGLVYVAGPLFDEGERWWIEQVEATIAATGLATFLPHRDNPVSYTHLRAHETLR